MSVFIYIYVSMSRDSYQFICLHFFKEFFMGLYILYIPLVLHLVHFPTLYLKFHTYHKPIQDTIRSFGDIAHFNRLRFDLGFDFSLTTVLFRNTFGCLRFNLGTLSVWVLASVRLRFHFNLYGLKRGKGIDMD